MKFHQKDITGKVCVVTGASSGLGRRIASDLAQQGAVVCLAARRKDRLEAIVRELPSSPHGEHSVFELDVTDRATVSGLAEHIRDKYGRLDVLVNNAGMTRGKEFLGAASIEDLEAVFATNFFGAVYCTAALLPLLEASAPSHVVNVASVAGRIAFGNSSAYCASKFALVGWSEAVHQDLKSKGVFVGLVEPGPIPTEGFPQTGLVEHPIMRGALGSAADVSRAVQKVISRNKAEAVVPRWYYLLQFPKLFFPGPFRAAVKKLTHSSVRRT